jgi:sugar O-acyltransferase (sialic acid O-acetyltransferase NeuD family)
MANMNLILFGGGGFAVEIISYLKDDLNADIFGIIDPNKDCEACAYFPDIKHIGEINSFVVKKNDIGLICLGSPIRRTSAFKEAKEMGLPLFTFIHSTASVSSSAEVEEGVIIGPHSFISANAHIKKNVTVNAFCGVGHGSTIGSHSVLSPQSMINGDCNIGEGVMLGSRTTLLPKTKIGNYSTIDAGCIIRKDIPNFSMVSQRIDGKIIEDRIIKKKISG